MFQGIKKLMFLAISGFLAVGSVCAAKDVITVQAAETPQEMVFLSKCNPESLKEWDEELGVFTEEQQTEIKAYMDQYILGNVTDDYRKAELIFEWITKNIEYRYDNSGANPYDVFSSKTAVCGGYSNLYKAMLGLADVPAVVLVGYSTGGAHAWSAVYADERWFYADSTWGKGWFDIEAEEFNEAHHTTRVEGAKIITQDGVMIGYDSGIAAVGTDGQNTEVVIPDSCEGLDITSVSYRFFAEKFGVKKVLIGKNISYLDTQFSNSILEAIEVSEDNQIYSSEDGVLYNKNKNQMLIYPLGKKDTSYTLPKETVSFDLKEAFANGNLVNLYVEEGNSQYSSCEGLLYNADQTELLIVPAGKTEIRILENAQISNMAFANIYDLNAVTIYAKKDSPAQTFAADNGIRFVEITEADVTEVFDDVDASWYTEYVQYVYDNRIMKGIEGTSHFAPEDNVTKAQVAQVLYNMEGQPVVTEKNVFTELKDVYEGDWYADAVAWAYNNGIITGELDTKLFNPNADVTREQLALMMYRYASYKQMDVSASSDLKGLENAENVNNWAEPGVKWAVGAGLISGVDINGIKDLAPQGQATRAQMAAILQRFCTNR